MSRTAIIAGRGGLPAALAQAMDKPLIVAVQGVTPSGLTPDLTFRVERLIPFLRTLQDQDVRQVVFAGAVQRPRLDPSAFDPETATFVPRLLAAMQGGDDATLREVIAIFEEQGLTVIGVGEVVPGLLPGPGQLCGILSNSDHTDAIRAAMIVAALGAVDVGQGTVVQQGLCLGVETLAGTDALLASVAALPQMLRPDPAHGRGLYYKAAKPGQDMRIDLPTLGPDTIAAAARAGLGGVAWQAGAVICLDLPAMTSAALTAGLFLWSRAP